MGWMTWERFRCTAGVSGTGPSCAADPDNCISEELVRQHADILSQPEWHSLGYKYVNIGAPPDRPSLPPPLMTTHSVLLLAFVHKRQSGGGGFTTRS